MNLLEMAVSGKFRKTGEVKKLTVPGNVNFIHDIYQIPLEYLYYNDQNGRINTTYKKYKAKNGVINPEIGESDYNEIFEKFIFESNESALKMTMESIDEKSQQEPGVVLPDGRVIDGNRRFTALRMIQRKTGVQKYFNAIILNLDAKSKADEKIIKELELDLQLGREERVKYDPIDRILDVYNTIEVEKLMTMEEYKKASGAGNTRGIKRDIRLANLIIRFISIISPGGNPIDKFYLARDLKLDGPIEEIEGTINKLKSDDKEAITEAVLVHLAVSKTNESSKDSTRVMRELKTNVLQNSEVLDYYVTAVDDKIDIIMDEFEKYPVENANDLAFVIKGNKELEKSVEILKQSTDRLINRGKRDSERRKALFELEDIRDHLEDIESEDFLELTSEEIINVKEILIDIKDLIYKLQKEVKI